jgi:hypothetical protein
MVENTALTARTATSALNVELCHAFPTHQFLVTCWPISIIVLIQIAGMKKFNHHSNGDTVTVKLSQIDFGV